MSAVAAVDEDRVREIVGESLSLALPIAVKLIEHRLIESLGLGPMVRPLFHSWGDRR